MSKTVEINGEKFEAIRSKYAKQYIENHIRNYTGKHINQCYEKPSATKKAIFEEWREWYCNTPDLIMFEVTSYNTFSFTLGCLLCDENLNYIGYIRITPAHNYLYLV